LSTAASVDIGALGLDGGGHVLVKLALRATPVGTTVAVRGSHPDLFGQLATWCRQQGHRISRPPTGEPDLVALVEATSSATARSVGATRAGPVDPGVGLGLAERPSLEWGLAARGALVEPGGPQLRFALAERDVVWTDRAERLYAQALAGQWDPNAVIDWTTPVSIAAVIETAVVQVMTFLIENEEAALVVPARFLG
jgi:hypothetical protein